ncbi:hypothetical protein EV641_11479 [Rhodococcus sp. SMB37]|uniref:hypothetical protein n=1 Tax=Rhodococcus sp. SMB37 TaxID=2512213 RepID=UPI00104D9E18|nr:hypothetical protein [Rhodococcus sp. SMB37]TCN49796.1 hypothetical protein EV641_11479 [Rhodococcus sp. SMB37]
MSDTDNPIHELLTPLLGSVPPESVARRQARHDELAGRVDSGVDPDYIAQFENFHGMEHEAIYQLSQTISPLAMTTLASEWRNLGTVFSFTVSVATAMIRDKIAQHWEGDAADAASSATELFGTSAQRLSDASLAVSEKLQIAADVGARVKSSVTPPSISVPLPMDVISPVAAADRERQEEAARQQAVRVMESLYKPYYRDSGSAVPVLPPPQDSTSAGAASTTPSGFASPFASGGGNSAAAVSNGSGAGGSQPSGSAATAVDGSNTTDSSETNRSQNGQAQSAESERAGSPGSESARTSPTSTAPTSTLPGSATGQPYGSSTTGSGIPGSGGYGGGGTAGGGAGSGGGSALGPGAVGGVGAAAAPTPAASQQGGAAARAGSMRPMGMYPGMMGGQQRGNEDEQRVASYLVTNDHGNELIGSLPDTAPPVLGVDPL